MKKTIRVLLCVLLIIFASGCGSGTDAGGASTSPGNEELSCTLSIDCKAILDNLEDFNKDKAGLLPEDGIILDKTEVSFSSGESVFDILLRETKNRQIHMEYEFTPIYDSTYIEGIANIYEFDCGELSGWTYLVNGRPPNYGLDRYQVSDGDSIEVRYACDLGSDM